MRNTRAFTLIEMIIAISIIVLMLMVAVPSYVGVMADRRLRKSLDDFNAFVHQAQERSLKEHRAYLIVIGKGGAELRPEILTEGDDPAPVAAFPIGAREALKLFLPAALIKEPPPEWIFWPTGTCEPSVVQYFGRYGTWTASYSTLSGRGDVKNYAVR